MRVVPQMKCVECIWILWCFIFISVIFVLGLGGLFGFDFLYSE